MDISHGVETESDCWLLKTEEDMHSFMRLLLAPMKSSKVYTDLLRAKLMMLKKVEKAAAAAEQPDVVDEPAAKKLKRTTKKGKKSKATKATNVPAPQDPEDNGVWTGITIAEEDTCNNRYVAQVLPKCHTQELREL